MSVGMAGSSGRVVAPMANQVARFKAQPIVSPPAVASPLMTS
jgi:hypothetical protein